MARIRIAEVVVVAALAGSLAACGGSSGKPAAAPVTVTSTVQAAPPSSATTAAASSSAGTSAPSATTASSASSAQPSRPSTADSSSDAATGGGVANAGDKMTIIGTLQYLAPGKFIVHPDDGSTDQGFYVADDTQILGAAAICGDPNGNVTIGGDGYGSTKCTEAELETAAKKNYVKVRVVMERKSGNVLTVEEKYHP